MKKTIPDSQLTENFSLYEFIEASMPETAVNLNWKYIDAFMANIDRWQDLANCLQKLRNLINLEFKHGNAGKEIGLKITSAFRCREWELRRGRNGASQHCVGVAADIQPVNCNPRLAVEIMYWLWDKHWPRLGGFNGGFAISKPVYTQSGAIDQIGFLHYDLRGHVARWEYL